MPNKSELRAALPLKEADTIQIPEAKSPERRREIIPLQHPMVMDHFVPAIHHAIRGVEYSALNDW